MGTCFSDGPLGFLYKQRAFPPKNDTFKLGALKGWRGASLDSYPTGSMYGVLTYIYPLNYPKVEVDRPYIEYVGVKVA